ncbi:MAG: prolipoprotein diacylglyceryl transferase [Clostridia bacterium]|nr:prolipoprotein diacylglyceryl transferase [Clostridia bacterium]
MQEINFEGLGLHLNINSVAVNIGEVKIYWYAVLIVLAFAIGILLCKRDNGKYNIKFDDILELMVFVIPISLICARLYFILFKLDYFMNNPGEILNIRNGGLAIYGGIIGAIVTIIIFCKKKKIKVLNILDYIAPFLALGQAIGRWGNFFNGEAHGTITNNFLRMGITENGHYIQVHPTFLYESICTLTIFIILYSMRNKRKFEGQLTCIYFVLYGIVRTVIEGFRTDSLMLGDFRISQILSILLSIVFGIILIYNWRKWKKINLNKDINININTSEEVNK